VWEAAGTSGVISTVLGIVAMMLAPMSCLTLGLTGIVAVPLGILGVVLCPHNKSGLRTAGLVLNVLAIGIAVFCTLLAWLMLGIQLAHEPENRWR
jgi:hypothetical protein